MERNQTKRTHSGILCITTFKKNQSLQDLTIQWVKCQKINNLFSCNKSMKLKPSRMSLRRILKLKFIQLILTTLSQIHQSNFWKNNWIQKQLKRKDLKKNGQLNKSKLCCYQALQTIVGRFMASLKRANQTSQKPKTGINKKMKNLKR